MAAPLLLVLALFALAAGQAAADCAPGTYLNASSQTCVDCGWHAFCNGTTRQPCSPFTGTNTTTATSPSECQVLACTPCPDASPWLVFSTGGGTDVKPKNSVFKSNTTFEAARNMTVHFLCSIPTATGAGLADVAVLANGDVVAVDTVGFFYRLPSDSLELLGTDDGNGSSPYFFFLPPAGGSWTGLSAGLRTDVLYASSSTGDVASLLVSNASSAEAFVASRSGVWSVPTDPWLAPGDAGTNGGTDLTLGPDGSVYRWSARDATHFWAGHRLAVDPATLLLNGSYIWTNRGIDSAKKYNNGGAFCSSAGVWAAAFQQDSTATVENAVFFSFGQLDANPVVPVPATGNASLVDHPAELVAGIAWDELLHVTSSTTSVFKLNGAATQPSCTTAFAA